MSINWKIKVKTREGHQDPHAKKYQKISQIHNKQHNTFSFWHIIHCPARTLVSVKAAQLVLIQCKGRMWLPTPVCRQCSKGRLPSLGAWEFSGKQCRSGMARDLWHNDHDGMDDSLKPLHFPAHGLKKRRCRSCLCFDLKITSC